MHRFLVACFSASLLLPTPIFAQEAAKPAAKNIDVVICLDVSSSMNGLINSAKAKLWDIVNEFAKVSPTPNLRVGLYSYGHSNYDAKIGWVRKEVDLTNDLDELYKKLFALTSNGGTEYVTRVCRDAMQQQPWSEDKQALRIIFVCGNEPANQDSLVSLKEAADLAKAKAIFINTIFCGPDGHRDSQTWRELAALNGGSYSAINQTRGTVAVATPVDKKLAELTDDISKTYLAYGKAGAAKAANQQTQNANAKKLGEGVSAARAQAIAGGVYQADDWCLVDRTKKDANFDVNKLPAEELPPVLRELSPEKRVQYIQDLSAKRGALQKEILELNQQRDSFLREHQKKNANAADQALDEVLRQTLRQQAETKGITIPKE